MNHIRGKLVMKLISSVLVALLFTSAVKGTCDGGCPTSVVHYEEIGCTAVFSNPDDCCPAYYDCSIFNAQSPKKCYLEGHVYDIREHIDMNITEKYCAASCFCGKDPWQDITCASIECPESWHNIPPPAGCYYAYKVNGCCTYQTVCPPLDHLAKCKVNGKTYYEGQVIEVPGREREVKCVCENNFQGKLEEPFCRKVKCGTELWNSVHLRKHCAPVFYGNLLRCPIQWECLQNGDHVVRTQDSKTSDKKCRYNNLELNIGDKLFLNRTLELNCECRIPPLVTCIQKPHSQ